MDSNYYTLFEVSGTICNYASVLSRLLNSSFKLLYLLKLRNFASHIIHNELLIFGIIIFLFFSPYEGNTDPLTVEVLRNNFG